MQDMDYFQPVNNYKLYFSIERQRRIVVTGITSEVAAAWETIPGLRVCHQLGEIHGLPHFLLSFHNFLLVE